MNEGTKNGFDLMEDLNLDNVSPGTTISNTNFFDIPLSLDPVEPVVIAADTKPKIEKEDEIVIPVKDAPKTQTDEDEESETLTIIDVSEKESYDDFNEFALIALGKIKAGNWDLDEKEIPKDLDAATLMDLMDAQEKLNIDRYQSELYTQAGEYANYLKFMMEGGSSDVVQDALNIKQLTLLDISEEENQKQVLSALLEIKGMEEDLIEDTIEALIDKGKAKEKAEEAIGLLKKYEENILAAKTKEIEDRRKQDKADFENHVKLVTETVKKGVLGGIKIDKKKQDLIINAMFKPTEFIEVKDPQTGKVRKDRVTKAKLLFNEMNKNPEKLAAMTLWLLEGGSFESIKDEIKEKKDDALREILKGRKTVTVNNTQRPTTNGFEILANRIQQI